MKRLTYLCLVSLLFASPAPAARADIFRWEYINPAVPSQGKQQSTILTAGGAGVDAVPGANLSNRNLSVAYLIGADLAAANFNAANLTNADLSHANLTNVDFSFATLTGANFTDAVVQGAQFFAIQGGSGAQLYSTASYKAHDLTGIGLGGLDLSGGDLVGQNLTNADFAYATLTGVNLTGAEVRGANFYRDVNGGSGITPAQLFSTASYQARDLTGIGLSGNYLAGANLAAQNLTNANLHAGTLTSANFSRSNLTAADLSRANLAGANLTGATLNEAELTGANIKNAKLSSTHITLEQLYSTANFQYHDLTGVHFVGNDLSGANLAGQNLTSADFYAAKLVGADFTNANLTSAEFINADLSQANLTGTNLTNGSLALANLSGANLAGANFSGTNLIGTNFAGADIRGASLSRIVIVIAPLPGAGEYNTPYTGKSCGCGKSFFPGRQPTTYITGTGITLGQLASTASYAARDLSDVTFLNGNFNGGNFAGFNLTNANFSGTTVVGADLSGADVRGAIGLGGVVAANFVRPDGHIAGLNLSAGQTLAIRDYDGTASSGPIPITVDQQLAMAPGGTLQIMFESDPWDSTISFAAGIPAMLDGTLELLFADGTDLASQIDRTFDLFDWTGVAPTGAFAIASPYVWDLSNLHTNGNVTLIAIPEPNTFFLLSVGLMAAWMTRRKQQTHTVTPPLAFASRLVPVLALLLVPGNRCLADPPEIQLTNIGAPTWKPVDFQLFSAPAAPFDQEFGQVYRTLVPYDSQPATSYTPHAPPYDTEFSAGMIAGGYVNQSVFTPDAITLHPNAVYFAFMLVPDPGVIGSSRDFAAGSVIPNSLFPIAANADAWLDGVLVDKLPGIDAIIPVQPKDLTFQGTSHLESLMAIWHPWDDDLTVGPLGSYDLRVSLRDVGGNGWDLLAPFRVALPGDFDLDGDVDGRDFLSWQRGESPNPLSNGDLVDWQANFGTGSLVATNVAVPEPATAITLLISCAAAAAPRRRGYKVGTGFPPTPPRG